MPGLMILNATLRRTGRLFGHVDDAEAAFADLLKQLVTVDGGARTFGEPLALIGVVQKTIGVVVCT